MSSAGENRPQGTRRRRPPYRRQCLWIAALAVLALSAWPAAATAGAALGPPAQITLSFSPSTIAADGSSTSTATATVTDAGGNPVPGETVTFSTSDPGERYSSAGADQGNGSYTTTITSSTTPGPVTVTATDGTLSGQGALYQYAGPAAAISIALNPPSIVADGQSTTTATARVVDSQGDPLPGETVVISSDSGNAVGGVSDNGDGSYSATVASTTKAGQVMITATDGGLSSTTTLAQTAGPATSVAVSLSPSSIVADGSSTTTATATVTDANGNLVPGESIDWSTDDSGNGYGGFASGAGIYTVTITSSSTVHQVRVTAVDASAMSMPSGSATLAQTVGPAATISVGMSPSSIAADGTSTSTATATVLDAEKHPVVGDTITFKSTDQAQSIGATTDHGDGTYTTTIRSSTTAGRSTVTAGDGSVSGTAALTETAGPASTIAVKLSPSSIAADGSSTTTATATIKDIHGNPIAGDPVHISTTDLGERVGTVIDNGDGTYTATITSSTTAGQVTITATDGSLSKTAKLTQTPGPAYSIALSLSPSSIVADGSSTTLATATVTDAHGNPIAGDPVRLFTSDYGDRVGSITDNANGSYTATVTSSTHAGQVTVTADDGNVYGTKLLTQTPGPASSIALSVSPYSIVANGSSTTTATAKLTDANDNPIAGDPVRFSTSDPGEQVGSVTDDGNGTYTTTVTSSTAAGEVTITATDGRVSNTAALTQKPGPANHVRVTLSPSSIVADGSSTTTATATVSDANGNPIAGEPVHFSTSSSGEKIGSVTDRGDGTYTATITSSTAAGQATITATDTSVTPAVSGAVTLTQTQVPATPSQTQSASGAPQSQSSAATVTVSLLPAAVEADGKHTTTAVVTVDDADGRGIAGAAVGIRTSDPGDGVSATQDQGNGRYLARITGSTSVQIVTVTATDYSALPALSGTARLIQMAGPASSLTLSFSRAGSRTDVTATLTDALGHPVSGHHVVFHASGPSEHVGRVHEHGDGTYTVTVTGPRSIRSFEISAVDTSVSPRISARVGVGRAHTRRETRRRSRRRRR